MIQTSVEYVTDYEISNSVFAPFTFYIERIQKRTQQWLLLF